MFSADGLVERRGWVGGLWWFFVVFVFLFIFLFFCFCFVSFGGVGGFVVVVVF